jgi:Rrf2 family protein
MLSMKAKYALKALAHLASAGHEGPVLIADLATRERIPKKFLELILLELKQHGLLTSKPGRGGGYALAKRPEDIAIGNVLRIVDGPLALLPCVSKTAYRRCAECVDETTCGIRSVMRDVHAATTRILDGTTLADMAERSRASAFEEALR